MVKEEWKPIPNWENKYLISNLGRVWSVRSGRYKKPDMNNCGYLRVQFCDDLRRERYFIHRLVASAFCGGFFLGADVNHKDADKTNNCFDNLEWVTKSENSKHAHRLGLQKGAFKKIPCYLVFKNGAKVFFDSVDDCSKAIGVCTSSLYNYLSKKNGYVRQVDAFLFRCVSNDYPFEGVGRKCARNGAYGLAA